MSATINTLANRARRWTPPPLEPTGKSALEMACDALELEEANEPVQNLELAELYVLRRRMSAIDRPINHEAAIGYDCFQKLIEDSIETLINPL